MASATTEKEQSAKLYTVSSSPHVRQDVSISNIMWTVVIALLPALGGAVYFFGLRALWITLLAVAAAVLTEAFMQKFFSRPVSIADGSAVITGMLVAFNVPPDVPLWIAPVGSVFGIAIAKHLFGGLGYNIMNPALAGRAFLLASWPVYMTTRWRKPTGGTISGIPEHMSEAITEATPLNLIKQARQTITAADTTPDQIAQAKETVERLYDLASIKNILFGNVGGCIGETSIVLLLIGAVILLVFKFIDWKIPFSYIATVGVLGWIFSGTEGLFTGHWIFQVVSGGLILGAFFMATDMVTSPVTKSGRWIFGIGCGILTVLIRTKGGYPEGVSYSILLMNLTVPLLDRIRPRKFGERKVKQQ
jgi:electron transport complex protein RnfD